MIKKLKDKIEAKIAAIILKWLYKTKALKFVTYKDVTMMIIRTKILFLGKEIDHIHWTDLEIYQNRHKIPNRFA